MKHLSSNCCNSELLQQLWCVSSSDTQTNSDAISWLLESGREKQLGIDSFERNTAVPTLPLIHWLDTAFQQHSVYL